MKEKNHQDLFDPDYLIPLFQKSWLIILISCLVGLAMAFFVNKISLPVYQVGASLLIKNDQSQVTRAASQVFEGMGLLTDENSFENELLVLKSGPLLRNAINNLDFQVSYFNRSGLKDKEFLIA